MKSFFMNNNDYQIVESRLLEHIKNNSGSVLKNNDDQLSINSVIKNEIDAFQRSRESLSFLQRAVLIDCKDSEPSEVHQEECATVIQSYASHWYLRIIPKTAQNALYRLLDFLPRSTVVQAAVKAGLVSISNMGTFSWALAALLLTIISGYFITGNIIITLVIASIVGIAVLHIFKGISLNNREIFTKLSSALGANQKGKAFSDFISSIADTITHNMPLVIIVEDSARLDEVSENVIKHITKSGEMQSAGALLWIVFRNKCQTVRDSLFENVSFPVKRYTLFKGLEL